MKIPRLKARCKATPKLARATRDSRLIGKIAKGFRKNL
jgi:hypothetical protein